MPAEVKRPKITIGADPELFVRDKTTGKIVSAHDLLPGTKAEPHKVEFGAVQVDGTAAEFNIDPAISRDHFDVYCDRVMGTLRSMLGDRYELVIEPTASFEPEYFAGLPRIAKDLGCSPDYNAWTGEVNPTPDIATYPYMRTASGHVHNGWGKGNFDIKNPSHIGDCRIAAKQMDYFVGIQSLKWDPDPKRRIMYGKAGSFRPKPYGMEYRTLSNMWLTDRALVQWVYDQSYSAIHNLFGGLLLEEKFGDAAQKIIDGNIVDWDTRPEYQKIREFVSMPPVGGAKPKKKTAEKSLNDILNTINFDSHTSGYTLTTLGNGGGGSLAEQSLTPYSYMNDTDHTVQITLQNGWTHQVPPHTTFSLPSPAISVQDV